MEKMIFSTDEIHAVRVELAERREQMTPDEAQRDYDDRVAIGKRRIEDMRNEKDLTKRKAL